MIREQPLEGKRKSQKETKKERSPKIPIFVKLEDAIFNYEHLPVRTPVQHVIVGQ